MAKNQKKQKQAATLEKILISAGLAVVALGCLASLFYLYVNRGFVHAGFLGIAYYLDYLILLGGGLIAGYMTARGSKQERLFSGVSYAFFAFVLYFVYDAIRILLQNIFGYPTYPLSLYVFEGGPLVALALTIIFAYVLRKQKGGSLLTRRSFIILFIVYQLCAYGSVLPIFMPSSVETVTNPFLLTIGSILAEPFVIMVVTFLLLVRVKNIFDRLFYATFVATFSMILADALWDFRRDPSFDATMVFQGFVIAIVLIVTILFVLKLEWITKKA